MGKTEWDPDYPEYAEWQGIITLEVPIAARAMSGREKHTDPVEQGMWIATFTQEWWREKFRKDPPDDIAMGEWKLVGHRDETWHDWENDPPIA
jgi:hypothetical protein